MIRTLLKTQQLFRKLLNSQNRIFFTLGLVGQWSLPAFPGGVGRTEKLSGTVTVYNSGREVEGFQVHLQGFASEIF